ncbi:hypothetical protein RI367_006978 [Sorochytrium milnesiophthora]
MDVHVTNSDGGGRPPLPGKGSGTTESLPASATAPDVVDEKCITLVVGTMTGNTFALNVAPHDTIRDVKLQIQRERSIPAQSQVLMYRERILHDYDMVEACQLTNGSTLQLVLEMTVGHGFRPRSTGKSALPDNSVLLLLCKQDNELYVLEVTVKDGRCTEVRAQQLGEFAKWDDLAALQDEAAASSGDGEMLSTQYRDEMEAEVKRILKRISRPASTSQHRVGSSGNRPSGALSRRREDLQSDSNESLPSHIGGGGGSEGAFNYRNRDGYYDDDDDDYGDDPDDISFPISSFCSAHNTRPCSADSAFSSASSDASVELEELEMELQQLISSAVLSRKPSRPATAITITRVAVRPLSGVALQRRPETASECLVRPHTKAPKPHNGNSLPPPQPMTFSSGGGSSHHQKPTHPRGIKHHQHSARSNVSLAIKRCETLSNATTPMRNDVLGPIPAPFAHQPTPVKPTARVTSSVTTGPKRIQRQKSSTAGTSPVMHAAKAAPEPPTSGRRVGVVRTLPQSTSTLTLAASSADAPPTKPRTPNRYCTQCQARPRLAGIFRCKCGSVFCATHRYPDTHTCTFDHQAAARSKLAKENPLVQNDKVAKF